MMFRRTLMTAVATVLLGGTAFVGGSASADDAPVFRRKPTPKPTASVQYRDDEQWKDYLLQMQSKNIRTVVNAVRQLGAYRNPIVVEQLIKNYWEAPDPEVRAEIIQSLGKIRSEDGISVIGTAMTDDDDFRVRLAAADVIARWPRNEWYRTLIMAVSFENEPVVMKRILEAIDNNNVDFWERMERAMRIEGIERRIEACDLLVKLDDPRAIELMRPYVKDPNVEVRRKIAFSLGTIRKPECVPLLREALNDQDSRVRHTALTALGEIATDESVDAIIQVLTNHRDLSMRRNAATMIGNLKAKRAIGALSRYIDAEDSSLRGRVITSLGQIGDPSVVPVLKRQFERGNLQDKVNVVSALGLIGGPEAVRMARANLDHEEPVLREMSCYVIGKLQDTGAVPNLIVRLDDKVFSVQLAAIEALGLIGDSRATQPLVDKLEGRTPPELDAAVNLAVERIKER